MTGSPVHLEDLLGAPVHDRNGRKLGHIFEMRGEERGGSIVIVEYYLGAGALLTRIGTSLRSLFGVPQPDPVRIPWNELDLSNPTHPLYIGKGIEAD